MKGAGGVNACADRLREILPRQELKRFHERVASGLKLLRDPFRGDPMPHGRAVR